MRCPVQLVLGSEDERVNTWAFSELSSRGDEIQKRVDLHLYPYARHAFQRPDWEGCDQEAANDAWGKTLLFVSQSE